MSEVIMPYRVTPVFDAGSLPAALKREHSTKPGVWGIIRILEGELRLYFADGRSETLTADCPGLIAPEEVHWVTPTGPMRMQVEFYDTPPSSTIAAGA